MMLLNQYLPTTDLRFTRFASSVTCQLRTAGRESRVSPSESLAESQEKMWLQCVCWAIFWCSGEAPTSQQAGENRGGQEKAEQYRAGEAAASKTSAFPRCLVSGGPHAFAEFNWVLRRGRVLQRAAGNSSVHRE
jgi:hypothetical protein